jgi:hypothetical protein
MEQLNSPKLIDKLHNIWFPTNGIVISWDKAMGNALNVLADEIERRHLKKLDIDPTETADWLRIEANTVTH